MPIDDLKKQFLDAFSAVEESYNTPVFKAAKKIISIERERFYGGEGKSHYLKEIKTVLEASSKEINKNENN